MGFLVGKFNSRIGGLIQTALILFEQKTKQLLRMAVCAAPAAAWFQFTKLGGLPQSRL